MMNIKIVIFIYNDEDQIDQGLIYRIEIARSKID